MPLAANTAVEQEVNVAANMIAFFIFYTFFADFIFYTFFFVFYILLMYTDTRLIEAK